VLQAAGSQVAVSRDRLCCGRPLYDFGMLDRAKGYLERVMDRLGPQIDAGVPFVVLEPSCASVFRDELRNLFPNHARADKLRKQTFLLSEFLERQAPQFQPPRLERNVLVHGHCHHKALMKMVDEESILKKMGAQMTAPDAGCCGMAGPFGFDAHKYDVSMAIGERVLLPAVRKAPADTLIVSDGFSCREQIQQGTGRKALHLAEVVQLALRNEKGRTKNE
jgi:Fe-S oxidoreductase